MRRWGSEGAESAQYSRGPSSPSRRRALGGASGDRLTDVYPATRLGRRWIHNEL